MVEGDGLMVCICSVPAISRQHILVQHIKVGTSVDKVLHSMSAAKVCTYSFLLGKSSLWMFNRNLRSAYFVVRLLNVGLVVKSLPSWLVVR